MLKSASAIMTIVALAACQPAGEAPASGPTEAYSGIAEGETVHFTGTEPFWGGEIAGGTATYSTPENIDGVQFPVERFAGNNGISFNGTMGDTRFDLMVTPGECSDGMSDRTYPLTALVKVGEESLMGCAASTSAIMSAGESGRVIDPPAQPAG